MANSIAQFDSLLSGYRDPATGLLGAGYTVEFYAVGTTTPKDVWESYDKSSSAVQVVTLDGTGSALAFGDGVYKLVVKNLTGAVVDTFDGVKAGWFAQKTVVITGDTTISNDVDVVICDTTSNSIVCTLQPAEIFTHPITFKKIAAANAVTLAASGTNTIDGAATYVLSALNANVTLSTDGATFYGAAATLDADSLQGYNVGTTENNIPLRGTDGFIPGAVPAATTSVVGSVELATTAKLVTGTDTTSAVTCEAIRNGLIVNGTLTTAALSAVDFTGIPAWAKRIKIMFSGLSTNGENTNAPYIRMGDSGGLETTGYNGAVATIVSGSSAVQNISTGIPFSTSGPIAATAEYNGMIIFDLMDSSTFLWAFSGIIGRGDTTKIYTIAGTKAMSAALTSISILSADTFDAGTANISYE